MKKFKVPRWLFFLFLSVLYFCLMKNRGFYEINKGIVEIFGFWFLYFLSIYLFWFYRYRMAHVCVNGFSGSIGREPRIEHEHAIFKTGEVYDPVHLEGKLATLVIPYNNLYRVGENYISKVKVTLTPLLNLPPVIATFLYLHKRDYNVDVIYYGKYSEEYEDAHPDIVEFENERRNYNRQINIRNLSINGDNEYMQELMETAAELGSRKSWRNYIPRFKKDEEE